MTNPESKAAATEQVVKDVLPDGTIVLMTAKEARAWRKSIKTREAAAILGRKGGLSRSEAKVRAAKENGKKGGAPRFGFHVHYCGHCDKRWVCQKTKHHLCPDCHQPYQDFDISVLDTDPA